MAPAHLQELTPSPQHILEPLGILVVHTLETGAVVGITTLAVEEALAICLRAVVSGAGASGSRHILFSLELDLDLAASDQLGGRIRRSLVKVGHRQVWHLESVIVIRGDLVVWQVMKHDLVLFSPLSIQTPFPSGGWTKATSEFSLQKRALVRTSSLISCDSLSKCDAIMHLIIIVIRLFVTCIFYLFFFVWTNWTTV